MAICVLFVDDEQDILSMIEGLFRRDPITVLTASSAFEGMDIIKKREVSVIVSDNVMPGMTGIEFLEWTKTVYPDCVRILMTGCADLPVAISAINRGEVFRFITKPLSGSELRRVILDSIERYEIAASMKNADESKLLSLARTIELKDPYTRGHCERVATYALWIADALNLPEDLKKNIKYGSWLHDCGKIGIPEFILNKPSALDAEQREMVKHHPRWGADVVKAARLHDIVINIVLYHHEQYNGKGYPTGLRGADIPLEARIVAVADAYDAATSERPYQKTLSHEQAIQLLRTEKNESLDPTLTDMLISAFETKLNG
jgi:putative two-component system response regulator